MGMKESRGTYWRLMLLSTAVTMFAIIGMGNLDGNWGY